MIAIHERFNVRVTTPFGKFSTIDVNFEQDDEHCVIVINGFSINISIAVEEAVDAFNKQNANAREQEIKYNRHEGRYVVKNLSLYGLTYKDNRVRLEYIWVDCYNAERVMYSPWFDIHSGAYMLFLMRCKGYEFYF
jgi:hypothetical protein